MATWIRIGDFARLAQVTVRTLRHYEHEGLLRPHHVRNRSGERYYDATQLLLVQRILVLRDLGLSIPDVRAALRCDDGGAQILNSHRTQLRKAILDHSARLDPADYVTELQIPLVRRSHRPGNRGSERHLARRSSPH